jgi:hypothetical protein
MSESIVWRAGMECGNLSEWGDAARLDSVLPLSQLFSPNV